MSMWAQVCGAIDLEAGMDCEKTLKDFIDKLPKFIDGEGSEIEYFVNKLDGYNVYTSCDCRNCEYGHTRVHLEEGGFECDAEEGYRCPSGKYQTRCIVSIVASLRDCYAKDVDKHLFDVFNKFDESFFVRMATIRIVDSCNSFNITGGSLNE